MSLLGASTRQIPHLAIQPCRTLYRGQSSVDGSQSSMEPLSMKGGKMWGEWRGLGVFQDKKLCPLCALAPSDLASPCRTCLPHLMASFFFNNCIFDMCKYQGLQQMLCVHMAALTEACQAAGYMVKPWRGPQFCCELCRERSGGGGVGGWAVLPSDTDESRGPAYKSVSTGLGAPGLTPSLPRVDGEVCRIRNIH